jgi:DNA transformation protein and related proteins
MAVDSFSDFVLERLAAFEGQCCKRMFGGYDLYCGMHYFAIVYDGRRYFKTNPATLPEYLACKV